ncbi:hypothetical protein [Acinetobacter shaoyimingii]|uniref:hypothetical protein n=1 Tax=Acinetobacter shaoyimingii TaxID=2715164 RepID=UPI003877A547
MKKILFLMALSCFAQAEAKSNSQNTQAIKQKIIQESIENYSGNCPCPYNTARNGSRCGKRSAYSRVGGQTPVCYPEDVTDAMIKAYRARK